MNFQKFCQFMSIPVKDFLPLNAKPQSETQIIVDVDSSVTLFTHLPDSLPQYQHTK